jgi:hypothetical protein
LGVAIHDRIVAMGWLSEEYALTSKGETAMSALGIDIASFRALRRRFAFPCLDWSERRSHISGSLGAVLLAQALKRRWVTQDLDSRSLSVTALGRREMRSRFGVDLVPR